MDPAPAINAAAAGLSSAVHCDCLSIRFRAGRGSRQAEITAVDQLCTVLPAGQITALVGPSGCGKTTLLRAIAGLQAATSGSIRLDPPATPQRGEVAFVFQQPALLPWRTALENVRLPLELTRRVAPRESTAIARDALDAVHLADARDRLPGQLSGGMRMRVSIARALVTRPRVLLLDEPFAALDDLLRNQLGQLLLELWSDARFTVVLVTHNIAEAVLLSHQVMVMQSGVCQPPMANRLPWPRTESLRRQPEFGAFYGDISDALRGSP